MIKKKTASQLAGRPNRVTKDDTVPIDGCGEDLLLEPPLVVALKFAGQLHGLIKHRGEAVVHRLKIGLQTVAVVATLIELFDAGAQSALLDVRVPGAGVNF